MNIMEFVVSADNTVRIDKYLALESGLTRSHISKLIDKNLVSVNGHTAKANYIPKKCDLIKMGIPAPEMMDSKAEDIAICVVYEDEDILVINKPRGMVVHPAAGNYSGTLVNALLHHCGDSLSGINGVIRPGIVHRIDKDTSGLLLVAKNDEAHLSLANQLKGHNIDRRYLALVIGEVAEGGTINKPIGRSPNDRKKMAIVAKNGKSAVTHYKVRQRFCGYTLLECRLETGRTHQIRVHLTSIGRPILGDPLYGPKKQAFHLDGQLLHAYKIFFTHPKTLKPMELEVEPPSVFYDVISKLSKYATHELDL